jgi:hypothetical protein
VANPSPLVLPQTLKSAVKHRSAPLKTASISRGFATGANVSAAMSKEPPFPTVIIYNQSKHGS